MLDKIFPWDDEKLFDILTGLVEKERVKMEPDEWAECLATETEAEFAKSQFSISKLPESSKKVLQLNFQIFTLSYSELS